MRSHRWSTSSARQFVSDIDSKEAAIDLAVSMLKAKKLDLLRGDPHPFATTAMTLRAGHARSARRARLLPVLKELDVRSWPCDLPVCQEDVG